MPQELSPNEGNLPSLDRRPLPGLVKVTAPSALDRVLIWATSCTDQGRSHTMSSTPTGRLGQVRWLLLLQGYSVVSPCPRHTQLRPV